MKTFKTKIGKNVFSFLEISTKISQLIIQFMALIAMIALSFSGIMKLAVAFSNFSNIYVFLKDLLHAIEILFIAPIPILIIYSFKKYIFALFKPFDQDTESYLDIFNKTFNSNEAEKAFITSIIGITSTFILGLFIELLTLNGDNSTETSCYQNIPNYYLPTLAFAIVFLVIQIALFRLIRKNTE